MTDAPDYLSPAAREVWGSTAPTLAEPLEAADVGALAMYCEAFARWKSAEQHVAADGEIVRSVAGVPIINPYLTVGNKAMEMCIRLAAKFGLTPADRGRAAPAGPSGDTIVTLIANYLTPLGLAGPDYPPEEHARLAAEFIRSARGRVAERGQDAPCP